MSRVYEILLKVPVSTQHEGGTLTQMSPSEHSHSRETDAVDSNVMSRLSVTREKTNLLSDDSYFREVWADFNDVSRNPSALLQNLALFSFKPDIVPARKMAMALEYLSGAGFEIAAHWEFQHNRHSMRELWRYNWHIYPPDRLEMCTYLHTATPTLVLLLRDVGNQLDVPAAVRLAALKGSANPMSRDPGQLRFVLEPPNAVINHVHVADEPIDVVREFGIFADRPLRRAVINAVDCRQQYGGEIRDTVNRLESNCPPNEFIIRASLTRCRDRWGWNDSTTAEMLCATEGDSFVSFQRLCEFMPDALNSDLKWDFLLIASSVLPLERDITAPKDLLPVGGPDKWSSKI